MSLSFSKTLLSSSTPNPLFLNTNFSNLTLHPRKQPSPIIRMGGGPRTYPGGVSKWQWKRMQTKKSKQLLKARLCRERQIYEMRKRAELKAAVTELERPWEPVQSAPNLFSVTADEQMKVLADRFQKPGGFDLWTERDGPQLFETPNGLPLPTARFFPKGVVHSVKPYRGVNSVDNEFGGDSDDDVDSVADRLVVEPELRPERRSEMKTGDTRKTWRKKKERASFNSRKREDMTGEVYDTNSQTKWGYRFRDKNGGFDSDCEVKMAEFQELE